MLLVYGNLMKGLIFSLLAALFWGLGPIMEKIGLSKISPQTGLYIRGFGLLMGLLVLYPFMTSFKEIREVSVKAAIFLGLGGLFVSVIGQLFFYFALKSGDISKVVPIAGSFPLIAFIAGILFFGETITISKIGGVIFIVVGIVLLG